MRVDKTIDAIREKCDYVDERVVQFVFDKLESERSLFWIQVARTIVNQLCFEARIANWRIAEKM